MEMQNNMLVQPEGNIIRLHTKTQEKVNCKLMQTQRAMENSPQDHTLVLGVSLYKSLDIICSHKLKGICCGLTAHLCLARLLLIVLF